MITCSPFGRQGRLNEVINGHRQVASLDVLERIADGLAMPGDARVLGARESAVDVRVLLLDPDSPAVSIIRHIGRQRSRVAGTAN